MDDVTSMCKEQAIQAMQWFVRSLSHVPADRLTWSPTPTAKSALQIAAHCAGYSGGFASIISAGRFPSRVEEFLGPIESTIQSITTVAQAETVLRKGITDTCAALDNVRPEQIGAMIVTPQGRTPFTFFMTIPAIHLYGHAAQIDYLQTCWGDLEVHLKQRGGSGGSGGIGPDRPIGGGAFARVPDLFSNELVPEENSCLTCTATSEGSSTGARAGATTLVTRMCLSQAL